MDEAANAVGVDPVAFRLRMLDGTGKARASASRMLFKKCADGLRIQELNGECFGTTARTRWSVFPATQRDTAPGPQTWRQLGLRGFCLGSSMTIPPIIPRSHGDDVFQPWRGSSCYLSGKLELGHSSER